MVLFRLEVPFNSQLTISSLTLPKVKMKIFIFSLVFLFLDSLSTALTIPQPITAISDKFLGNTLQTRASIRSSKYDNNLNDSSGLQKRGGPRPKTEHQNRILNFVIGDSINAKVDGRVKWKIVQDELSVLPDDPWDPRFAGTKVEKLSLNEYNRALNELSGKEIGALRSQYRTYKNG